MVPPTCALPTTPKPPAVFKLPVVVLVDAVAAVIFASVEKIPIVASTSAATTLPLGVLMLPPDMFPVATTAPAVFILPPSMLPVTSAKPLKLTLAAAILPTDVNDPV